MTRSREVSEGGSHTMCTEGAGRTKGELSFLQGRVRFAKDRLVAMGDLRSGDALIASGSLVEGTGNYASDLDLFVFTDQLRVAAEIDLTRYLRVFDVSHEVIRAPRDDLNVRVAHYKRPEDPLKIDFEYVTWRELYDLAAEVERLFKVAERSLITFNAMFGSRKVSLLHKVRRPEIIIHQKRYDDWVSSVDFKKVVYILYRSKASDYSDLLDILGAWHDGALLRCADLARENLVKQFHAFTHLHGNTNNSRKWLIVQAERTGVDAGILNSYVDLLRCPLGTSEQALRQYVRDSLDFVDTLFQESRLLLEREPLFPSGPQAIRLLHDEAAIGSGDYGLRESAYRANVYTERFSPTQTWLT